jgi:hypothetical protein
MPTGKGMLRSTQDLSMDSCISLEIETRRTRTIASGKVQGIYLNRIKRKECFGNPQGAGIRQTKINLDAWIWKSLEDSLPKMYCVDLAEAYVMQESTSLRLVWKERYDPRLFNGSLHQLEPKQTCKVKLIWNLWNFYNFNYYIPFYVGTILKELLYDQTHLLQ